MYGVCGIFLKTREFVVSTWIQRKRNKITQWIHEWNQPINILLIEREKDILNLKPNHRAPSLWWIVYILVEIRAVNWINKHIFSSCRVQDRLYCVKKDSKLSWWIHQKENLSNMLQICTFKITFSSSFFLSFCLLWS